MNGQVRFRDEPSACVIIRTKDQRVFVKEQNGHEGGLTNPMSWERTVEKFHWLAEAFANEELSQLVRTNCERDVRIVDANC